MVNKITKPGRIVILLGAPFTEQNYERIGIPYLSAYFEVMVFDCTELMGRNIKKIKFHQAKWRNFSPISSELELATQLEKYQPHFAIDFIGFGSDWLRIYQILTRYNVKLIIQKTGSLPYFRFKNFLNSIFFGEKSGSVVHDSKSNGVAVSSFIILDCISNLIGNIKLRLKKTLINKEIIKKMPECIGLVAGYMSLDRFLSRCKPIIWNGSNDYHTFIKAKAELISKVDSQLDDPFILFIDDNLPNASDWIVWDIFSPVTARLYYLALNNFFERIELLYGMPVRVAGNPSSVGDGNYQSHMGGRTVVFGNTAPLVLQSALVLFHGSTAISFAVMARKPILSLITRELAQSHYGLHIKTMAKTLGTVIADIDQLSKPIPNLSSLVANEGKYSLYEKNYICNDLSTESKPWGALIEFINGSLKDKVAVIG